MKSCGLIRGAALTLVAAAAVEGFSVLPAAGPGGGLAAAPSAIKGSASGGAHGTVCSSWSSCASRGVGFRSTSSSRPSSRKRGSALSMMDPSVLTQAHEALSGVSGLLLSEEFVPTYSKASYYTTLGLYVLSFPGLWSVIKRAAKTKYKERVYEMPGPSAQEGAKEVKQTAAEIIAYFTDNNYKVGDIGEKITFEGNIQASKGQAFFLVFCTALCLATLALVLQIQFPDVGAYWFALVLLSPYAGVYYWQNSSREDKAVVRLETMTGDEVVEMQITAGEEELDRMSKAMGLQEKGMIRVKGLLETDE